MELDQVKSQNIEEIKTLFEQGVLNPNYESLFDERVIECLGICKGVYSNKNREVYLGKSRALGGLLNIPSTNIFQSDVYKERIDSMDFIFDQLPKSKVIDIYGDIKNEYKEDDFNNKKILRIHNFKRNIDLIELLTCANSDGIKYKGIRIPKLTIFADTSLKNIPSVLKKNCLILKACSLDSILNLDEEKGHNYVFKEGRLNEVKQQPEVIDAFINTLQSDLIYEYPNEINVIQYFSNNKAITRISLNEFLTNIKITTALNQTKRLYYTIEQEQGEEGKEVREEDKRIILSHPVDTVFNFELCKNLFKLGLDLPDNEEFFFSYILKWVRHDSEVDTYKQDKDLPHNDSKFFKGSIISQDYMNYIKNHPEYKEDYLRIKDTYRRTLLKFSDHPKRGKSGLLIFKPKKKSDLNTPNEYCLNRNYYIYPFKYSEEKYHYLNEYYNFCGVLEENKEKLRINLEKSTFPCLNN